MAAGTEISPAPVLLFYDFVELRDTHVGEASGSDKAGWWWFDRHPRPRHVDEPEPLLVVPQSRQLGGNVHEQGFDEGGAWLGLLRWACDEGLSQRGAYSRHQGRGHAGAVLEGIIWVG